VKGDGGEPWFVAKDVCSALGLNQVSRAVSNLDEDEVTTSKVTDNLGRIQKTNIVSEGGLYSLIFHSRKPEAHAFKRWVTHEVLPSIRKDGGYIAAGADESDEQIMARALHIADKTIRERDARIAELEPKALFADAVAASDGTCLIADLAKILTQNGFPIGQNRLFERLRRDGYLGSVGGHRNVPTQRAMEMGLFRIKETAVTHSDGHVSISRTPKVTGKGQRYFVEKYCGALS
jgi:anti-repressor protein